MKKMLTVVFGSLLLTSAFAQSGNDKYDKNRDDEYYAAKKDKTYDKRDSYHIYRKAEMERQVESIRREYERKINAVQQDRRLKAKAKKIKMEQLEKQRNIEIRKIMDNRYGWDDRRG